MRRAVQCSAVDVEATLYCINWHKWRIIDCTEWAVTRSHCWLMLKLSAAIENCKPADCCFDAPTADIKDGGRRWPAHIVTTQPHISNFDEIWYTYASKGRRNSSRGKTETGSKNEAANVKRKPRVARLTHYLADKWYWRHRWHVWRSTGIHDFSEINGDLWSKHFMISLHFVKEAKQTFSFVL